MLVCLCYVFGERRQNAPKNIQKQASCARRGRRGSTSDQLQNTRFILTVRTRVRWVLTEMSIAVAPWNVVRAGAAPQGAPGRPALQSGSRAGDANFVHQQEGRGVHGERPKVDAHKCAPLKNLTLRLEAGGGVWRSCRKAGCRHGVHGSLLSGQTLQSSIAQHPREKRSGNARNGRGLQWPRRGIRSFFEDMPVEYSLSICFAEGQRNRE